MTMRLLHHTLLTAAAVLVAWSQTAATGVYTATQATAGEAAYKTECASCHGNDLEGSGRQIPPLVGKEFIDVWRPMSLGILFEKLQSSMPADKPGKLTFEQNTAILAYLLQRNGFPAGPKALPADPDALKQIQWGK